MLLLAKGNETASKVLELCANGTSCADIVNVLEEDGVLNATEHDVKVFIRENKAAIAQIAVERAQEMLANTLRSKKSFVLTEVDNIAAMLRNGVGELGNDGQWLKAARLAESYFKAIRLIGELTGDLSGMMPRQQNVFIQIMQEGTAPQRKEMAALLKRMNEIASDGKLPLPEPDGDVVEGEFTVDGADE